MEGYVDDPSVAEILEVVDRPLQAAPNPSAPGGGGASWANHARVRGRGRGSRGGRGGGRRGGGGYGEVQFERGDLPPRFQCKPQN